MTMNIPPSPGSDFDQYLMIMHEVYNDCMQEKETLKKALVHEATELAKNKKYSSREAKTEATSLVGKKIEEVKHRMENMTSDPQRQKVIRNTWHTIAGELYSPLQFKSILEEILRKKIPSN